MTAQIKRYSVIAVSVIAITLSSPMLSKERKFLDLFSQGTDVDQIYNAVNNIEWSNENLQMLHDLWERNLDKYPNVSSDLLDHDIVRLALANILMQARRHCRIKDVDMDELRNFVLSKTKSDNLRVRGRATYLLGLSGYDEDIPYLSSVIRSEKQGYAEEAALALTFIHSEAALDALRGLLHEIARPSLRDFLQQIIEKYEAYPLIQTSKGCQ